MHITLIMVMSADGKTTRWHEPNIYTWTSQEDSKHFFSLLKKSEVIIMGSGTFLAAKSMIKPSPKNLRIVLTKKPRQFADLMVPDQLEFVDQSPEELIMNLMKRGYEQALLVGGSTLNASFLKTKLVDQLLLTIEPKLFASGTSLIAEARLDIDLQLQNVERLNEHGTLVLTYDIVK